MSLVVLKKKVCVVDQLGIGFIMGQLGLLFGWHKGDSSIVWNMEMRATLYGSSLEVVSCNTKARGSETRLPSSELRSNVG